MRPTLASWSRAQALRLLPLGALLSSQTAFPTPAVAEGSLAEEVRRAASVLPGYGPPDIVYPRAFKGRWRCTRTVAAVSTPLGEEAAPAALLSSSRELLARGESLTFDARFLPASDDGGYIADRGFNAEQRAAAPPGAPPLSAFEAKWDASNPNVLTLADRSRGSLVETKVTKRSVETPDGGGGFGTSEYARIADAGSAGVLSSVPVILASRVQTRYRWAEPTGADAQEVGRIEGLELTQMFDPAATGFADLAGATPVLTVKARLEFTR